MNRIVPGRPATSEFAPYYGGYVAQVSGEDVLAVLETQRTTTLRLLGSLPDSVGDHRYAPGKWSVKEVLGHVIDGERVFGYRALSFARGEEQPQPGFDQDEYVRAAGFDRRPLAALLEEYETVRRATITLFGGLDAETWLRTGTANSSPMSVRAVAFVIAGHEAHHMKVLEERYLPS